MITLIYSLVLDVKILEIIEKSVPKNSKDYNAKCIIMLFILKTLKNFLVSSALHFLVCYLFEYVLLVTSLLGLSFLIIKLHSDWIKVGSTIVGLLSIKTIYWFLDFTSGYRACTSGSICIEFKSLLILLLNCRDYLLCS